MPADSLGFPSVLRTLLLRRRGRQARTGTKSEQAPEAARLRAALEMHDLGVRVYRQRMHREHPYASEAELDDMVRVWLAEPPPSDRLRLPSRERNRGIR
jgi:hypothetical protein